MDGPRLVGLVRLCGADLGHDSHRQIQLHRTIRSSVIYPGPRWWGYCWDGGLAKDQDGLESLGLYLPLVLDRPTGVTAVHAHAFECKPLAQHSGGLGTNLQQLLEILVCLNCAGRRWLLGSGIAPQTVMAPDSPHG